MDPTSGGGGGVPDSRTAQEIARAMQAIRDSANSTTKAFEDQLRIVTQLRDAINQMAGAANAAAETSPMSRSVQDWQNTTASIEKAHKATENANTSFRKVADFMKSGFAKGMIIGASAVDGLLKGFKNLYSLTKSVGGFFSSVAGGAFKVAKAVVAIPFTMISKLFSMAQSGGGSNELAQALEETRGQFGDLRSEAAQTVIQGAKSMDGFGAAGVSALRVFGNVAERMKLLNKLAGDLGPLFTANIEKFKGAEGAILGYEKGLGLTNEMMAAVTVKATQMGTGVTDVLLDMTKQSLGLAKATGLNAKTLSRDMGKAMQDVAHYGHLSAKELGANVAYANKLGVAVEKLTGLMDQFDTFDSAAESTSKLNEQFGTNIDAQEIMSAQSPGAKLDILRKQFAATGKELKDLTYQERKLIAANTGLDASTLDTALAQEKAGVSFDDMLSASEQAEKQQMSQAEAMHELAKAMERIPQAGGGGGGLFAHIFEGFTRGIQSNKEFIGLMRNINVVMREATQFGVKLGKMFVDLFPGVKDIFGGLQNLFDPKRFKKMFDGVLSAFDVFKKGGSGKMEDFTDRIKKVFTNFFDEGAPAGKKVLEGFRKFFEAMLNVIGTLGAWLVPKLAEVIVKITDWIRKPKVPKVSTDGLGNVVMTPMEKALEAVKEKLVPALKDLAKVIWERLKEAMGSGIAKKVFAGAALTVLAPALFNGLLGAGAAGIFSGAGKLIAKGLAGGLDAEDAAMGLTGFAKKVTSNPETMAKISSQFTKLGELLGPKAMNAIPVVGWAIAIGDAAINISEATKKFGDTLQKKGFDPATSKIAAGATGVINALTFGLLPDDLQEIIATTIAEVSGMIFNSLDKFLGPGFSDSIKKFLAAQFDFMSGLGDLLVSMWHGDSKGVNAALVKIGEALFDSFMGTFEMTANVLLKIGPMILEYLYKSLGWVSSKIGDIFLSLKDIPVVGFIFEWIGDAFKMLGSFLTQAGEAWGKIGEILKKVNITQTLRDWGTAVVEFTKMVWDKFTWLVDVLTLPFRIMFLLAKTIFLALWEEVISPVLGFVVKWGGKMLDALMTPFKAVMGYLKTAAAWVYTHVLTPVVDKVISIGSTVIDVITWPFKKSFEIVKSVFEFGWGIFTGFMSRIIGWERELYAILTDPYTKSWDKIKAVMESLFGFVEKTFVDLKDSIFKIFSIETFSNLFEKIVEGVKKAFGKLADSGPFKAVIEIAKKVFKIESPSKVFEDIGDNINGGLNKSLSEMPNDAQKHFDKTVDAAKLMQNQTMQQQNFAAGLGVSITPDVNSAKTALQSLKDLGDLAASINNTAANISQNMSSLPSSLKSITDSLTGNTLNSIPIQAVQASIDDFKKIIDTIQQVDDALAKTPKINLSARLGTVAGSLGLGSSGVYTVKSKEVVINVNFEVYMDAAKVENAIVMRKESIIRDRINYLVDNSGKTISSKDTAHMKSSGPANPVNAGKY
jgi:roadblock/LC7 domain-containing protein